MPGLVKVKVVGARNLPIMDRSSELTDAFVEVKLGQTVHRTEVCPKTLNPKWEHEQWMTFTVVDDEELQDEPLQIRVMDYDTYSAHDAIGKVYICLNALADGSAASLLDGWFPIFDTLHGVRGEVYVRVKVELIKDHHHFKQSSCGIQFFACPEVPRGYTVQSMQGFVEELVVNDDPEYQWLDKIRTPRSSNEARQRLFFRLSGELQRRVGLKVMELGGNAVIGYRQSFDLEGESGIVVRAIGTCVTLIRAHHTTAPANLVVPPSQTSLLPLSSTAAMAATAATVSGENSVAPLLESFDGTTMQAVSPKSSRQSRNTSSPDSDGVHSSPVKVGGGAVYPVATEMVGGAGSYIVGAAGVLSSTSFPYCSLSSLPAGSLRNIGGIVSARSVKLLDKIYNPEEPETRDAWWHEIRTEVRSHSKAMGCNAVIGYSESTSICDSLCVFSAVGTAVCLAVAPSIQTSKKLPTSPSSTSDVRLDPDPQQAATAATAATTVAATASSAGGVIKEAGAGDAATPEGNPPGCGVCHVPYSLSNPPFEITLSKCAQCRSKPVPSVLLSTGELPPGLAVRGRGGLVQARAYFAKKRLRGDENAFHVSKHLPFLEYSLHGRLINKLHIMGMNAVFGLRVQVAVGDTMVIGVATGTGMYLEPLPPPPKLRYCPQDNQEDSEKLLQHLDNIQEENRRRYGLEPPQGLVSTTPDPDPGASGEGGEEGGGGTGGGANELDLSAGNREAVVFDVAGQDLKREDLFEVLVDRPLPKGFSVANTHSVPGVSGGCGESRMVTMVTKVDLAGTKVEKELAQVFHSIMQGLVFKVRGLHPCLLTNVKFHLDLPENDELQVAVTAMATHQCPSPQAQHLKGSQSDEMIFAMEDPACDGGAVSKRASTPDLEEHRGAQAVHITPMPFLPGYHIDRYLGIINLFLIRESTSIKEHGGVSSFMHLFILEAQAIARAHVAGLGGNALQSYRLSECELIEHPHKNQAQCLLNLSGDAVELKPNLETVSQKSCTNSPRHKASEATEVLEIESSPKLSHRRPVAPFTSAAEEESSKAEGRVALNSRAENTGGGGTSAIRRVLKYHVTKL